MICKEIKNIVVELVVARKCTGGSRASLQAEVCRGEGGGGGEGVGGGGGVEALYEGHALAVTGVCLLVTAALLALTHFYKPKEKEHISPSNAFVIGIAQALAVLPGLSRSGSTIATGLLLGNSRKNLAQFSFLMVIPPILGEAILECKDIISASTGSEAAIPTMSLIVGFLAAFVSGCFACKCMIALVKKCKLIYFAAYCAIVGAVIVAYNILS